MSHILFYKTETTGIPLFREPSEDPRQPHIVQIAAMLVDTQGSPIPSSSQLDVIVRPDGWTIPDEAVSIHGITTSYAMQSSISERAAIDSLMAMWLGVAHCLRVAHNEAFHARIVRIALMRHVPGIADAWKAAPAQCTAKMATPIMKLPPTERMRASGRGTFKAPNIREAYKHFTGNQLGAAHNAMAEVQACAACYFAMLDATAVATA